MPTSEQYMFNQKDQIWEFLKRCRAMHLPESKLSSQSRREIFLDKPFLLRFLKPNAYDNRSRWWKFREVIASYQVKIVSTGQEGAWLKTHKKRNHFNTWFKPLLSLEKLNWSSTDKRKAAIEQHVRLTLEHLTLRCGTYAWITDMKPLTTRRRLMMSTGTTMLSFGLLSPHFLYKIR